MAVATTIAAQSLVLAQPLILGQMVRRYVALVTGEAATADGALLLSLFVLSWSGAAALQSLTGYCNALVVQDLRVVAKDLLFADVLAKPREFFINTGAGAIDNWITTASMCCRGIYLELANSLFRCLALTIFAAFVLGRNDRLLAAYFLGWVVLYVAVSSCGVFNRAPQLAGRAVAAASRVSAHVVDVLSNMELVCSSRQEDSERRALWALLRPERDLYQSGQLEVERAMLATRLIRCATDLGVQAEEGKRGR